MVVHLSAHLPSHNCSHPILFCWVIRGLYSRGASWGSTGRCLNTELRRPCHNIAEMHLSVDVELERESLVWSKGIGWGCIRILCKRENEIGLRLVSRTPRIGERNILLFYVERSELEAIDERKRPRTFFPRWTTFCAGSEKGLWTVSFVGSIHICEPGICGTGVGPIFSGCSASWIS